MNTRRSFLQQMATSTLGVTVFPHFADAATVAKSKAEHVIFLYMAGGMSHLDTFDPKDDPTVKGEFNSITTNAGQQISEHLPGLAKHGDKMAIIRSLSVTTGDHAGAQYLNRTGYKHIGTIVHPALGAWMCNIQDDHKTRALPQNVLINGPSDHPGSGWMAKRYSPVPIHDPLRGLDNSTIKNPDEFNRRISILNELNKSAGKAVNASVKGYGEFYDQTIRLLNSKDTEIFDISKESKETREKYGNNKFGQGLCLAKRLIEKGGVKFVEVTHGGWDTHNENFKALTTQLATVDQALTALIEDLRASGLLSKTLIVIATDFGRTPTININNGRDHFPKAFSQVLIGAGIKGGTVYGQTNKSGTEVADKQISIQDFNATVAAAIGITPEQKLVSPEGRPFTLADKGKVITELLA